MQITVDHTRDGQVTEDHISMVNTNIMVVNIITITMATIILVARGEIFVMFCSVMIEKTMKMNTQTEVPMICTSLCTGTEWLKYFLIVFLNVASKTTFAIYCILVVFVTADDMLV